jgi:hypothetical protein
MKKPLLRLISAFLSFLAFARGELLKADESSKAGTASPQEILQPPGEIMIMTPPAPTPVKEDNTNRGKK